MSPLVPIVNIRDAETLAGLAAALLRVRDRSHATEDEAAAVWHFAFRRFCFLLQNTMIEADARRHLLRVLERSGCSFVGGTAAARATNWRRKLRRWLADGRSPEVLRDSRLAAGGCNPSLYAALASVVSPSSLTVKELAFIWSAAFAERQQLLDGGRCDEARARRIVLRVLAESPVRLVTAQEDLDAAFSRLLVFWEKNGRKPFPYWLPEATLRRKIVRAWRRHKEGAAA